jgi:hypothetical protein
MLKSKGKTCMVEEPSHVKQLSLNHVCKVGLSLLPYLFSFLLSSTFPRQHNLTFSALILVFALFPLCLSALLPHPFMFSIA